MTTTEFAYRTQTINGVLQSYPTIPIRLRHFDKTLDLDAMIDTGSTYSIFKAEIADALGIPLERGRKTTITSLREFTVGYIHEIEMQVLDEFFAFEAAFSRDLKFSLNLIGRKGFLDKHAVEFRQFENKIIVTDDITKSTNENTGH